MTRAIAALAILGALGCAGDFGNNPGDDGGTNDAPTGCAVFLSFDPMMAIASPSTQIRATANVTGAPGVLAYTWQVKFGGADVAIEFAQPDHSAISFVAAAAGPYQVAVSVDNASCPTAQGAVNVGAPGGATSQIRLRVFPPPGALAPPTEKLFVIPGGAAYALNTVAIDPGVVANGFVRMGSTGVQSYLRFIPAGARDAYVEGFTAVDGSYTVRVQSQLHDVLIVPIVAGYAPRVVEDWLPGTAMNVLPIDPGQAFTGTVRDPQGSAIVGAKVQLAFDGTPSTLTTTDGNGAFTVAAQVPAGAPTIAVTVTPPAASGLPRVSASSAAFTSTVFAIAYDPGLVRRDVGGTVVRRNAVAQPGAPVKLVGTLTGVATVTAGVGVPADGEIRIPVTANGSGALPAGTLAPAALLSAVTTIGGELAVDAFDLRASVPATIEAPPLVQLVTAVHSVATTPLPNAVLELAPAGPLALAGAPTIRGITGAGGAVTLQVPAGGRFDVRASDPLGRGAQRTLYDVPVASLAASYALEPALRLSGTLILSGNPQPIGRAAIQILCTLCTGIERTRSLADGASSSAGGFDIPIYDPGVD